MAWDPGPQGAVPMRGRGAAGDISGAKAKAGKLHIRGSLPAVPQTCLVTWRKLLDLSGPWCPQWSKYPSPPTATLIQKENMEPAARWLSVAR